MYSSVVMPQAHASTSSVRPSIPARPFRRRSSCVKRWMWRSVMMGPRPADTERRESRPPVAELRTDTSPAPAVAPARARVLDDDDRWRGGLVDHHHGEVGLDAIDA